MNEPAPTICIGVETPTSDWLVEESIHELQEFAKRLDVVIVDQIIKTEKKPNQLSYIGKGKLTELKDN